MQDLIKLTEEIVEKVSKCNSADALNDVRVEYLGKKGVLTLIMKEMKDLSPEERPAFGQKVNDVRQKAESAIASMKEKLEAAATAEKLSAEKIDVTLPAKEQKTGHPHPCQLALDEMERIFVGMGYEVVEGREVEWQ